MNFSKGYIEPSTAPQPRMDYFDPIFHDTASCDFLTLLSREKTPPHEATPLPPCPFPAFNSTRNFSMHIYRYLTYSMSDTVYVTYSTVYVTYSTVRHIQYGIYPKLAQNCCDRDRTT